MKIYYLVSAMLFLSLSTVNSPITKESYVDKVLHQFANSRFITELNIFLAEGNNNKYDTASPELQELGKEAQKAVGLLSSQKVPILETDTDNSFFAMADCNAIIVNKRHQESYAIKRCNMHHEAVHIKYKDYAVGTFFSLTAFSTGLALGFLATKRFGPKGYFKLLYPLAMFSAAHVSKRITSSFYKRYSERRADREGYYATACSVCLTEKANDIAGYLETQKRIYNTRNERISLLEQEVQNGNLETTQAEYLKSCILSIPEEINEKTTCYLSPEENREIATILEQENKICDFHKK